MSAPPFTLLYTDEAQAVMNDLQTRPRDVKTKKVKKALRLLRDVGPSHRGLESHKYHSLTGPNGEDVWESYVENRTPSAWRIWWVYGPDADTLTITTIGPHP
jgi:hypothetical protein